MGPLQWLEPSTDAEIRRAGRDGKGVIVAPIAFVSEHSETLVELDIEYAKLAREAQVPDYRRAAREAGAVGAGALSPELPGMAATSFAVGSGSTALNFASWSAAAVSAPGSILAATSSRFRAASESPCAAASENHIQD